MVEEEGQPQSVVIPYTPRGHFRPLHASKKRFRFMVVHRRGGKTVSIANELLKGALTNTRQHPPPRYGYVGPSFSQSKDTIWAYIKYYTGVIPGVKISESDLSVTLPNGAMIVLYPGADAYERMRGIYFDGVAMDEFALLNADAWPSVVRPTLADYRGWAIVAGTSNGDDHFREMKAKAEADPENWDIFDIKVTDTDAIHPDEVSDMRKDMGESRFAREMLNEFDAPVEGAYYGELINDAQMNGRICDVPHDPRSPVFTMWDLGMRDLNAIWFCQRIGRELRVIDFMQSTGKGLEWYYGELHAGHRKNYNYHTHVMPHDIMARELGTGRSRYEVATDLGFDITVCPNHRVDDGIQAVRSVIPIAYFDANKCANGISALKSYKQSKSGKPLHDWASHASDAFRTGSVALDLVMGWSGSNISSFQGALKRRIKGLV